MKIYKIGQRDNPTYEVHLKDADDKLLDLTSANVLFRMKKTDGTVRFERAMDISFPATDGKASITLTAEETNIPGRYEAQIFVDDNADVTVSVDNELKFIIIIQEGV